jgi:hypothetical protein
MAALAPPLPATSRRRLRRGRAVLEREKCVRIFAHKNTGDLQGANLQKYNIRPCNREKKGSRHETIKNNEKNRRKQSKNNGDRAPRGNKKPADEQRRAAFALIQD